MLTTPRLWLRPFTLADLPFLDRLHRDPDVVRFLGDGRVRHRQDNLRWMERTLGAAASGLGQQLVERLVDRVPIGRAGGTPCWLSPDTECDVVFDEHQAGSGWERATELGYTFRRSAWGQGYATEAAEAMAAHLLEEGGRRRLVSVIHEANSASFRVSQRLGFRRWRRGRCMGRPVWVMRKLAE